MERVGMWSILLCLLPTACGPRLEDQASVLDGGVLATSPADGAWLQGQDLQVVIAVGTTLSGSAPPVTLRGPATDEPLDCDVHESDAFVLCSSEMGLVRDEDYTLVIARGDQEPREVGFTQGFPPEGQAFLVTRDTDVVRFGAEGGAAEVASAALAEAPLVLALVADRGSPTGATLLLGPGQLGSNAVSVSDFPFAVPVEVGEDGSFATEPTLGFLPVGVGAFGTDITVRGRLGETGIDDFVLRAIVPAVSIVALAEPLGAAGGALLGDVVPDHDLDLDGEPDAVSLVLEGRPPEVALLGWSGGGRGPGVGVPFGAR